MAKVEKAFVTGVTGQDGSYLVELLLDKGYEVHGLVRRSSNFIIGSHEGYLQRELLNNHKKLQLYYGDLSDYGSIEKIVSDVKPDEVYNLGAMSDVRVSFDIPEYTGDVTGLGALRVVEAVRAAGLPKTKIYQASTSEVFGRVQEIPQKETTPFYPRSPYAASKVFAHWICKNYRESYGMFIASGILFNHESPRRGPNFVTRKITRGVANILLGRQKKIYLGNLNAKRDWGYAPEYVEGMWLMLQQEEPDDYVLATGETHTVREFIEEAFAYAGIKNWRKYVEIKKELFRPAEADILVGDPSKARRKLGWKPKTKFKDLVRILVDADIELAKGEHGDGGR
jgi:GDPmannose 4,6-dehydratase